MQPATRWTVDLEFTESDTSTRADARLVGPDRQFAGWGRSRRNPVDPDVPAVGEELAAARALSDLARQLDNEAIDVIEGFAGASPSG
ncbi:MAG TPA: DUF1876 domain-containing protein [Acidimicrobiales bacterium]|nr:DUF1876 domain-containing protein [Acidimicrobiales bacterium]